MRRIENSKLYPWLLLTPTLIFFAIWNIVPLFWMVGMSFYNYSLNLGRPPRFVGFDNYTDYLDSVDVWLAVVRPTLKMTNVKVRLMENIRKSYGSERVLDGVNLRFERGRFSVVLGSPVSGKSVLMRLIMGLEPPDNGRVFYRGQDVTAQPAGLRNFGYVPQSFALYPHYRVFDNIAYPLILAKKKTDLKARVEKVAKKLRIDHLLSKYPNQLSGGEKQRVALARGRIKDSSVFILDDPLVGLDFKLRESLFVDLRDMLSEVEGSVILQHLRSTRDIGFSG
jgi:ABC-type nitrate/sulfonate/bicarbonate transport system ATPase subunit